MSETIGFIDVHAHILPEVDDGSGSIDETIRMLTRAYEQGIRTIIATPHYASGARNTPTDKLHLIREQVQLEAHKISPEFTILPGNEIFYSGSTISRIKSGEALTLAGSRYVLIEFSTRESYNSLYQGMSEVIRSGFLPVLAHVERYRCFYKKEYLINDLIELGCYIQMNSSSVLGRIFDTEANYSRKLIKQGLVHLLGSDCHDDMVRIPCMKGAEAALLKKCDESLVQRILYRNPSKVLQNTYI